MKTEANLTEKFFHTEKLKIYKMEGRQGQGMTRAMQEKGCS